MQLKNSKKFLNKLDEIDNMGLSAMSIAMLQLQAIAENLKENNLCFEDLMTKTNEQINNS